MSGQGKDTVDFIREITDKYYMGFWPIEIINGTITITVLITDKMCKNLPDMFSLGKSKSLPTHRELSDLINERGLSDVIKICIHPDVIELMNTDS